MKRSFSVLLLIFLVTSSAYAEGGKPMHNEHQYAEEASETPKAQEDLGICPVMGGQASPEYSYTYEGTTYYFCCPMCIEAFKKDPDKYIAKVQTEDEGIAENPIRE